MRKIKLKNVRKAAFLNNSITTYADDYIKHYLWW
jgi:hypothetical protein